MKKLGLMSILIFFGIFQGYAQSVAVSDSLDQMIGQMILIGLGDFNALDKSAPVFEQINAGEVGGLILFAKNFNTSKAEDHMKEILNYAQSLSDIPLFVGIDQEGGRVNRLKTKYGFPKTVSAEYLGKLDNLDSTRFYALQTAEILSRMGINMNFAPSVDVNINPENPIIGKVERSYSADPYVVARHAQAVVESHDQYHVATVLKHFPGHGSSHSDSHLGLTDVSKTWRFKELIPYKALLDSGKVRAVMTAHIVNEVMDENKLPSTLSPFVISEVLRDFLGYQGVVVSDDMQMKAISSEYGVPEAIKMAINAGVDILLFANNVPDYELITAGDIHRIIKGYIQKGELSEMQIRASYGRIMALKKEIGLLNP